MSAVGPVTLEEWAALDEDDSRELVDGWLEEAEVPDFGHEIAVLWLGGVLRAYFVPRGGVVGGAVKFALSARRGRLPDLCVFASSLPPRHGLVRRPPDILVEVVSRDTSDQRRDRIAKVDDYAQFGAKQCWLLDPTLRSLEVLELESGSYRRAAAATHGVVDMPGCPGLTLDLDALWAELDALPEED